MKSRSYYLQHTLLFLNGAFALAFELLWCKRLEQLSGVGLFAVTLTVSCFMLGLALGGLFGAKLCDLRNYQRFSSHTLISLQASSTILCLLFSAFIFSNLPYWIVSTAGLTAWQIAGCLLTLPVLLVGMLLPVAVGYGSSNSARDNTDSNRSVGILYAANLLGSLVGTIFTTWWLIPLAGLWHSVLVATGIGLVALCSAVELAKLRHSVDMPVDEPVDARTDTTISNSPIGNAILPIANAMLLVAISGFSGMALEIIWVRISNLLLGSSVYALALVLICFLLSNAAGAWAAAACPTTPYINSIVVVFAPLLAAEYLYGELFFLNQSPWYYILFYKAFTSYGCHNFAAQILTSTILLLILEFVPVFVLGAFFVTVLRLSKGARSAVNIGYLTFANNLGGIAGAWTTGYLMIPALSIIAGSGVQKSAIILGVILCVLSLCALFCGEDILLAPYDAGHIIRIAGTSCTIAIAYALVYLSPSWNAPLLSLNVPNLCRVAGTTLLSGLSSCHELNRLAYKNRLDFYCEGLNSTVSVLSNPLRNVRYMKIDGLTEGAIPIDWSKRCATCDLPSHLLLAELPLLVSPSSNLNAYLVGYGTGTTAEAILCDSRVKHMRVLELEKAVVKAAHLFSNPAACVLSNAEAPGAGSRIELHLEDARSYLLRSHAGADILVCQPSEPWVSGAAGLFTQQYWEICRHRLTPNGVICQWIQLYGLSEPLLADLCRTFITVFPNTILIHEPAAGEIFLLAGNNHLYLGNGIISSAGLSKPTRLGSSLVLDPAQLKKWCDHVALKIGDNRINTDDNLLLEYAMPYEQRDPESCIAANLAGLSLYHLRTNSSPGLTKYSIKMP